MGVQRIFAISAAPRFAIAITDKLLQYIIMRNNAFLQSQALFGGFSDDDLAVIRTLLEEETFAAGEAIVREGEQGDRFYFIESGNVLVSKNHDNEQRPLATLGPGDAFGEMELIDIQARSATVTATEPVTALTLTNRAMFRLYQQHLDLYARLILNLAREISRRLRKMDERITHSPFGDES